MTLSPISTVARWGAALGTRKRRDVWRLFVYLYPAKTIKDIEATNLSPCVQRETHGDKESLLQSLFAQLTLMLNYPLHICSAHTETTITHWTKNLKEHEHVIGPHAYVGSVATWAWTAPHHHSLIQFIDKPSVNG